MVHAFYLDPLAEFSIYPVEGQAAIRVSQHKFQEAASRLDQLRMLPRFLQTCAQYNHLLRKIFGPDLLAIYLLVVIALFSPHLFLNKPEQQPLMAAMAAAQARYAQLLKQYLAENYRPQSISSLTSNNSSASSSFNPATDFLQYCLDRVNELMNLKVSQIVLDMQQFLQQARPVTLSPASLLEELFPL